MHVFLLGVQREINEIKRTIAHLHGPAKPKPDVIAQLGLGQFVACWGGHAVTTYVQPWWAQTAAAQEAARMGGRAGVHDSVLVDVPRGPTFGRVVEQITETIRHADERPEQYRITDVEDPMDAELKRQNERLERENAEWREEAAALRKQVDTLQRQLQEIHAKIPKTELESWNVPPAPSADPQPTPRERPLTATSLPLGTWPAIRAQILSDEQVLMKLATLRPEIEITVERRVQAIEGGSLKGRVAGLIARGWINSEPKRPGEINKELNRTGGQVHPANLGRALNDFVLDGFLTRENDGYAKAPAIKVTTRELQAVM